MPSRSSRLCGTLNYAARMPIGAVNAAVRDCDRLEAAAVADPFSGETFWTDGRASRVRVDGRDTPLAPTGLLPDGDAETHERLFGLTRARLD